MRRQVLAIVMLAACRINFDDITGATGDASGDASGDGTATCTDEVCNGIDDNCDGAIDENCGCTPFDTNVPATGTTSGMAIAWTGTGYLLVLLTGPSYASVTVSATGTVSAPLQLPVGWNVGLAGDSSVWTGSEHVVAYQQASGAWTQRFDDAGKPIGPPTRIDESSASNVVIARRNNRIGAAWSITASSGGFRELDLAGVPVTSIQPIPIEPSSMIRTQDRYLFAGRSSSVSVVVALLDAGGTSTAQLGTMNGFPRLAHRDLDAAILDAPSGNATVRALTVDGMPGSLVTPVPAFGGSPQTGATLISSPTGYRLIGLSAQGAFVLTEFASDATVTSGPTAFTAPQAVTSSLTIVALATAGRELVVMPYFDGTTRYRVVHSCR